MRTLIAAINLIIKAYCLVHLFASQFVQFLLLLLLGAPSKLQLARCPCHSPSLLSSTFLFHQSVFPPPGTTALVLHHHKATTSHSKIPLSAIVHFKYFFTFFLTNIQNKSRSIVDDGDGGGVGDDAYREGLRVCTWGKRMCSV